MLFQADTKFWLSMIKFDYQSQSAYIQLWTINECTMKKNKFKNNKMIFS